MDWQPYFIAIIPLLGVLISAIISYVVTRRTLSLKLQEIKEGYSKALHTKRIELYPLLYKLTSQFATKLFYLGVSDEDVEKFNVDLQKWDEDCAIFTGQKVVRKLYELRQLLSKYSNEESRDYFSDIYPLLNELEFELKREIGVFDSETFDPKNKSMQGLNDYNGSFFS